MASLKRPISISDDSDDGEPVAKRARVEDAPVLSALTLQDLPLEIVREEIATRERFGRADIMFLSLDEGDLPVGRSTFPPHIPLLYMDADAIGWPLKRTLSMTCRQYHALLAQPALLVKQRKMAIHRAWEYWIAGYDTNASPRRGQKGLSWNGDTAMREAYLTGALVRYRNFTTFDRFELDYPWRYINAVVACALLHDRPTTKMNTDCSRILGECIAAPTSQRSTMMLAKAIQLADDAVLLLKLLAGFGGIETACESMAQYIVWVRRIKMTDARAAAFIRAACCNGRASIMRAVLGIVNGTTLKSERVRDDLELYQRALYTSMACEEGALEAFHSVFNTPQAPLHTSESIRFRCMPQNPVAYMWLLKHASPEYITRAPQMVPIALAEMRANGPVCMLHQLAFLHYRVEEQIGIGEFTVSEITAMYNYATSNGKFSWFENWIWATIATAQSDDVMALLAGIMLDHVPPNGWASVVYTMICKHGHARILSYFLECASLLEIKTVVTKLCGPLTDGLSEEARTRAVIDMGHYYREREKKEKTVTM